MKKSNYHGLMPMVIPCLEMLSLIPENGLLLEVVDPAILECTDSLDYIIAKGSKA